MSAKHEECADEIMGELNCRSLFNGIDDETVEDIYQSILKIIDANL